MTQRTIDNYQSQKKLVAKPITLKETLILDVQGFTGSSSTHPM